MPCCRLLPAPRPKTTPHSTSSKQNTFSAISPSGHRPASSANGRSSRTQQPISASAVVITAPAKPSWYIQIEFGPTVSAYSIRGVPGLDDANMAAINGFTGEIRSVLIDRNPSPIAVTMSLEPEFRSRDETSGVKVVNYELEAKLEADAELIKNRLFLGFNLLFEPETTRGDFGIWQTEATVGASAALALQIVPNVVIGADLWYLRHYDSIAFGTFTGDAVYLGPTLFWKISSKMLMSAAWETQVAGREVGVMPALDLTDFSRQRARLLFEFEF